jgi:alpha-L-rhamnosidase
MKYCRSLIFVTIVFAFVFASFTHAAVKYVGEDKKTLGDWPGKYGKNGALVFAPANLYDMKDISKFDDMKNLRWDWANPTADKRGAVYPADPGKRAGSCMYNNPNTVLTLETKLKGYQVAVYAVDWDSTARSESFTGYQGGTAPKVPDVTIKNPDFNAGIYEIWTVTGTDPFNLKIDFVSGANWVITGIFIDATGAAVEANGKLATTWGDLKK